MTMTLFILNGAPYGTKRRHIASRLARAFAKPDTPGTLIDRRSRADKGLVV
jgi:sulfur relay (sulfurtransferase) complex TusBCD TusD component (DsrE family)